MIYFPLPAVTCSSMYFSSLIFLSLTKFISQLVPHISRSDFQKHFQTFRTAKRITFDGPKVYAKKAGRVHEDQLKVCSWEVSHYFWRPPYLDYFRWQFFVHHHVRTICDYLMDSHHLKTHPLELLFSSGPSWCRVLHRWTRLFGFLTCLTEDDHMQAKPWMSK